VEYANTLQMTFGNIRVPAMPQVVLLQNNRRLSHAEVARARVICDEALGWVCDREAYINQHSLDRRFALPDANWSYDAPNEFVQLSDASLKPIHKHWLTSGGLPRFSLATTCIKFVKASVFALPPWNCQQTWTK